MITHLPVVTRKRPSAACGIIRAEMENGDGEGRSVLVDWVLAVKAENPQIAETVAWMMADSESPIKLAGLIGMAVTYNALKAQVEVEALERLAGEGTRVEITVCAVPLSKATVKALEEMGRSAVTAMQQIEAACTVRGTILARRARLERK